jgi:hypothetical protein
MVDAIYSELDKCDVTSRLPTKERILRAREDPLWEEEISRFFPPPQHATQTDESYREQCKMMNQFGERVSIYRTGWKRHRNLVTVGGGGVGKTACSTFCTLYCLAKGLRGVNTSLVSDRSKELGGIHFHRLLCIIGHSDDLPPGRVAELATARLYRHPEALEFIRTLDFVNLDEFGVFSAENLAVFDMVVRYVRGSTEFMAGLLVYCTLDHLQLLPFHGTPVLLSMYVVNEFSFFRLVELVRAANDAALREIIRLIRLSEWTAADKALFTQLLTDHCVFVQNFDDPRIPPDAVFVFGRKRRCRAAEDLMVERMK